MTSFYVIQTISPEEQERLALIRKRLQARLEKERQMESQYAQKLEAKPTQLEAIWSDCWKKKEEASSSKLNRCYSLLLIKNYIWMNLQEKKEYKETSHLASHQCGLDSNYKT